MSARRILPTLLIWDVKVQAREHVYLFTVLTTGAFATAILLLPEGYPTL
jgi:hypothetical protein